MEHFLSFLHFCPCHCCLLNSYMFLLSMQQTLSMLFHLIRLSLIQLLFYFFLLVVVCPIHNSKYQILFQHLFKYLPKWNLFFSKFLSPGNKILLFLRILVSRNYTKTYTLQCYFFLILKDLNRLVLSLIFVFYSFLWLIHFLKESLVYESFVAKINNFSLLRLL